MTSKSKSELSRARILDAARDSILPRGFTAMKVDAICRSAGITKAGASITSKAKMNSVKLL